MDDTILTEANVVDRPLDELAIVEKGFEQKDNTLDIPPEGGLQGWLCVVGSLTCLFCTFGFLNAYVLQSLSEIITKQQF